MIRSLVISAVCAGLATPVTAQLLEFPAHATRVADQVEVMGSYQLPIGPYDGKAVQNIAVEGQVSHQAWQIQSEGSTTLQLLAPLRAQLDAAGFQVLFECQADACGGFDFRYGMHVLPEPEMHVDLGDYRFLATQRMQSGEPEYVSLLVSRSALRGFVQVTRVGPELPQDTTLFAASTKSPDPSISTQALLQAPLSEQLQLSGRAILAELSFATGSSELTNQEFKCLSDLAAYLNTHPGTRVALVGHTDAEGALENNIALSRKRAQSVMQRLISAHNVPAEQLSAEGVGFLVPVASNQTDSGRTQNRRVEVIITSTP